jgi:hypothetical protein
MRIGFLNGRGTKTHSEYVIEYVILVAFPQQQWLYEPASVSRYTCGTLPVFLKRSLNSRQLKLFYFTLHKALALTPQRIQSAFFKGMDGQKKYIEAQFIINDHYLNRVLFYVLILVTHTIILLT